MSSSSLVPVFSTISPPFPSIPRHKAQLTLPQFKSLTTEAAYASLSARSRLIATYAVCGFGNISSVGIQIGVLSQLAPGRSGRVAKVAVSALISGVITTLTSASIDGMLIEAQETYIKLGKSVV